MSAMNGFDYWSPADEEQGGGSCIMLGVLMGVLFVGVPICIAFGWI